MDPALTKDLVYLIMQYLDEANFKDVLHKLEQESGLFFDMGHLEKLILAGKWSESEKYLSGFTNLGDNRHSRKIYFEIRKQNYFEALDDHDRDKAADILNKDLKVFADHDEGVFKELTHLITLENIRVNEQMDSYNSRTGRRSLVIEVEKLVKGNPLLSDKLNFPTISASRLNTLIDQSFNFQHSLCPNPKENQDMKTLYLDHSCEISNETIDAQSSATNNNQLLLASPPPPGPQPNYLAMLGINGNFQPQTQMVIHNPLPITASTSAAPPPNGVEKLVQTISRTYGVMTPRAFLVPSISFNDAYTFPRSVLRVLSLSSAPTCMDFHPIQQTLIMVGTNAGKISLWEVSLWEHQIGIVNDQSISVKKVLWSDSGTLFGVAYSKNMLQLYHYHGGIKIRKHLEFDAHDGSVNDLAFSNRTGNLCVITCGDDKLIKLWDAANGSMLYLVKSHSSPVSSVCPSSKKNLNCIYSTTKDGKTKTWLCGLGKTKVAYKTPCQACTELTYSEDGKRLFSCGTSKEKGESRVVEWDEIEGTVTRAYQGFRKNCVSPIHFGIAKNRFLAAGDDHSIKIWDINDVNMLTSIDADGDLPASPLIRFNSEGSLLAVSANGNNIKILALDGNNPFVPARPHEEEANATRALEVTEITQPSQLRSLRLKTLPNVEKISRLLFTNSGKGLLALASNGVHLLWKRARLYKTARTKISRWSMSKPGNIMTNDLTNVVKPEDAPCCIALSKNDSHLMSSSGGKITLFAMESSKTVDKFMGPPTVATCLAFHPKDSHVVAMGLDDSTIFIFNVHTKKVMKTLRGHSKRITGLAFSNFHRTLISSGADSKIVRWNLKSWKMEANISLNVDKAIESSNTEVQFHIDQTQILVSHQFQVSIHDPTKLDCMKQWVAEDSLSPITQATFSADCKLVYALFLNGTIFVFDASTLLPRCLIRPSAYIPANVMSGATVVMAANPKEGSLVAVVLSDGGVVLLDLLDS